MKLSPSGEILWKTNLPTDPDGVGGLQFVNGNLILYYADADWNEHYCLIDGSTGEILVDAISMG